MMQKEEYIDFLISTIESCKERNNLVGAEQAQMDLDKARK
jgi:hypothetical protein